ncbi:MAG: radical SAM protein [Bacteroidia bacterium]|nr:radical SAM protein [Bacteroidia bacterium]
MSPDDFRIICKKIKPFTSYIYLHVLGEPLLHPRFEEILKIAAENELNVNITTNGSLISRKKDILLRNNVRQINISLHDAEENIAQNELNEYLNEIFEYAKLAADNTYVNLRLWNAGETNSNEFNQYCTDKIKQHFPSANTNLNESSKEKGIKLANHIFLQTAPRFEWPDGGENRSPETRTCYALRDQIAILAEGTVVPCCLDADGNMNLGNVFEQDLAEILGSTRAQKIRNGFINHKITEEFCKSCGFFI